MNSLSTILGHGDFRYRLVPGWGALDERTPVKNGQALAQDRAGHIYLLTDHTANNVIIYDRQGRLVAKWGTDLPGAHGLSLVVEGGREVLYLTCTLTNRVRKTTLDGQVLQEWGWPEATGKYAQAKDYMPSWTLHHPDGSFFVLDGYGKDYILHHGPDGRFLNIFGGPEGGIEHWGPHGGHLDFGPDGQPNLLLAMCDRQYILRLTLDGRKLQRVDLPGSNPRMLRRYGAHWICPHIGDNWPADFDSRGYVSVLDADLRVVSNIGGTEPQYDASGGLQPMRHVGETFLHPHDALVDPTDGALYVAQSTSGANFLLKLERV